VGQIKTVSVKIWNKSKLSDVRIQSNQRLLEACPVYVLWWI